MVRVLIPVYSGDIHAKAVRRALRSKGHEAVLFYGADYPTRQLASLSLSQETGLSWKVVGADLEISNEKFDIVWYRRPMAPALPDDMHPGDRAIANRECQAFTRGFWQLVAPGAIWINPLQGRERAHSKPLQLFEALKLGLKIPPTLCSNDPDEIRRFLDKYPGEAIYKSYWPSQWEMKDNQVALVFTTEVTPDDLPYDHMLRLSPGIFQQKVEKAYELRVTYMGDYAVTTKMDSQKNPETLLDWRHASTDISLTPATLPENVDYACRRLMKALGIVFGCFDFIVTPEDEYIFLEVNEMGQFLWIEEVNPEILLLETFCNFLIQGWLESDWKVPSTGARFADFADESPDEIEAEERLHVPKPNYHTVVDSIHLPEPSPAHASDKGQDV
jgi:hypothetical protein